MQGSPTRVRTQLIVQLLTVIVADLDNSAGRNAGDILNDAIGNNDANRFMVQSRRAIAKRGSGSGLNRRFVSVRQSAGQGFDC